MKQLFIVVLLVTSSFSYAGDVNREEYENLQRKVEELTDRIQRLENMAIRSGSNIQYLQVGYAPKDDGGVLVVTNHCGFVVDRVVQTTSYPSKNAAGKSDVRKSTKADNGAKQTKTSK